MFINNTAGEAGDSLYGGAIDRCLAYSIEDSQLGFDMFDSFSAITDNSITSSVASDPFHVCACINDQLDCNIYQSNVRRTLVQHFRFLLLELDREMVLLLQ